MMLNPKRLALFVMVVAAASAVTAPAASAQQAELTSDGPVTLMGSQASGSEAPVTLIGAQTGEPSANALTAFGGETRCSKASYTGHRISTTPHQLIPDGAQTITITPHYGTCTALGFPATIDMNGCDYVADLGVTNGADSYATNSTVICPAAKNILITIFGSANKHSTNEPLCNITITEKEGEGYAGLSAVDTTNGKVDIAGTITNISAHKSSPTGSILCPTEATNTASLKQDITVEGKDETGEAVNVEIQHENGNGELVSDAITIPNGLTAFEGQIECSNATYTGHKAAVTPHEEITSGATAITLTPHYGTCDLSGLPVTIDMNGCDYLLELEDTAGVDDTYGTKATIVCSGGSHVQWTVFSSGSHVVENRICTLTFTEKEGGYTGLHATDTGNGKVHVAGSIEGITVHRAGGGILCPGATTEASKLDIDTAFEGKSKSGAATSISLSEEPPTSGQGFLTSDGGVTLSATQTGEPSANTLSAFGGEARCPNATFTGHKVNGTPHEVIPNGATEITVTPHYGACTSLGFPMTIDMNGCDYVFHVGNATGEDHRFAIKWTVTCPAGKGITMTMFSSTTKHTANEPFCHMTITENAAGYNGLTFEDTTNGTVDLNGTVSGIAIHKASPTGSILCPNETTNNASLKQDVTIVGKNAAGSATAISLS